MGTEVQLLPRVDETHIITTKDDFMHPLKRARTHTHIHIATMSNDVSSALHTFSIVWHSCTRGAAVKPCFGTAKSSFVS